MLEKALKKISSVIKKKPSLRKEAAPRKKNSFASARPLRTIEKKERLVRHNSNPIVEPRDDRFWEMKATFNPGALYVNNRIHLLYRAIGIDDVSLLGYASSEDGVTFIDRSDEPVFIPFSVKKPEAKPEGPSPLANAYFSGGGWNGGCEDPRLTLIENVVYLTYTAFDGWGSIRVALSSITLNDFLAKKWNWKNSALISPPGEIHKNWVLFPEKINGKFAILHSISPDILVDYFDSLDDFDEGKTITTSRYSRAVRTGAWDSWIRGVGPPPLRTRLGWLLIYHAMDVRDPDRYKLGAMILDINDPTKILYRSKTPILQPDFYYENQGFKAGVVYSCGAVIKDQELYVYYGGGDSVVCVAIANLETFLNELKDDGAPTLIPEIKPTRKNAKRRTII